MRYEVLIGLRYLRAKRRQTLVSLVTAISIGGVALGVAALIVVIAVMSGFESDLRTKILGANAHIFVMSRLGGNIPELEQTLQKVSAVEGVTAAAPVSYSKAMIRGQGQPDGCVVKGITSQSALEVTDLGRNLIAGSIEGLHQTARGAVDQAQSGIIIGDVLAETLGVALGDSVRLMTPTETLTPVGVVSNWVAFKIVGVFHSGMYDYDSTWVFVSLDAAQRLNREPGRARAIELKVVDMFEADKVAERLRDKLGERFWVRDWMQMNRNFFSALKLEKIVMFIILLLIVLVAAFNIVSSLTMMVMEKGKDIGILKAMGSTSGSIMGIFLVEGLVIGLAGTVSGATLGVALSVIADKTKLIRLAGDVYYISYVPFHVDLWVVLLICFTSMAISFLATLYPSFRASNLNPVEAIRYE